MSGTAGWGIPPKRAGIMAQNAERRKVSRMLHFTPGSHAHRLITLLSVVGEYPMNSVCLLGGVQVYKTLIRKMCEKQVVHFDDTGEELETKLLNVSGKGQSKTIRLYKGALPILDRMGAGEYYRAAFDNHKFRGDLTHRERNHRVAEAVAMSMRAGFEVRPYKLAPLQNREMLRVVSDSPAVYPAKQLKDIGVGERNKTQFTRLVGALFSGGECYALYNTRNAVMRWGGEGEFKARQSLIEAARLNAGNRTIMESDRRSKNGFRFDRIYPHIIFIPQTDSGIRRLSLMAIPNWREQLLDIVFDRDCRSYGCGAFEYDAFVDGKYIYSHLDGDIARLIRFRDAWEDMRHDNCEILCYPEQVAYLREYLGRGVAIVTIRPEQIEAAMKHKEEPN